MYCFRFAFVLLAICGPASAKLGGTNNEKNRSLEVNASFEGPAKFCTENPLVPRVSVPFTPNLVGCVLNDDALCASELNLNRCLNACQALNLDGCCGFNTQRVQQNQAFGCSFSAGGSVIDANRDFVFGAQITVASPSNNPVPTAAPTTTPQPSTVPGPSPAPSTTAPTTTPPPTPAWFLGGIGLSCNEVCETKGPGLCNPGVVIGSRDEMLRVGKLVGITCIASEQEKSAQNAVQLLTLPAVETYSEGLSVCSFFDGDTVMDCGGISLQSRRFCCCSENPSNCPL